MLYKFKSRATADLIMLEPHGRKVLQIVGKSPDETHGIITAEQIPAAIAALQAAVQREESAESVSSIADDAPEDVTDPPQGGAISLRQRTAPLLDMLRRSAAEGYEVIW